MANRGEFKVISKRNGLKKALKELAKFEKSCVTVGIHKGQGRLKKTVSGGRGTINMATLAKYQETDVHWTQKNTVVIPCADGESVVIPKGTIHHKPARIFVNLQKIPNIWAGIGMFISTRLKYLSIKGLKLSSINKFWESVGSKILEEQQNRIRRADTVSNSETTQRIKGFNHPLFDTGALLGALSFKRVTGKAKSKLDGMNFDMNIK